MTRQSIKQIVAHFIPPRARRYFQELVFSAANLGWKLSSGIEIEVRSPTEWTLLCDIFIEGEYDTAIENAIQSLSSTDEIVVVDLGANVGFFLLRLFHQCCLSGIEPSKLTAFAVEPDRDNMGELQRRLTRSGAWSNRVELHIGMIGEQRSGSGALWRSHNHHMCTVKDRRRYKDSWKESANYLDLEAVVRGLPIKILKCDIEGAELDFVNSYPQLLFTVELLILEIHDPNDRQRIRSQLAKAGLIHEVIVADRPTNSVHLFSRKPLVNSKHFNHLS